MSDQTPEEPTGKPKPKRARRAKRPTSQNGDHPSADSAPDRRNSGGRPTSAFAHIRHPRKRAFLRALVELGTVVRAAKAAKVDRSTLYTAQWREDAEFQQALEQARVMAADLMEEEAYRRAVEGVEKPTGWFKGEPGGYVREYSDLLLMFTLKGLLPEKYRETMEIRDSRFRVDWAKLAAQPGGQQYIARLAAGEHYAAVFAGVFEQLRQAGIIQAGEPKRLGPGPKDPPPEKRQQGDSG